MSHTSQKRIGLFDATIVELNAMVGAGIFSIPLLLRAQAGPAGLITYLLVTAAVWCLASSLGLAARHHPGAGSFYNYVKPWGGHIMGLLTSGVYLVGLTVAMGLLAQLTGSYLHDFIPYLSATTYALIVIGLLAFLCRKGVGASAWVQYALIVGTIAPMLIIILLCLTQASLSNLIPFMPHGIMPIITATRFVIFGFLGFECVTSLYDALAHPERTLPRSITYAVLITGTLYCTFVGAIMLAIPSTLSVSGSTTLPELMLVLLPEKSWLISFIAITIIIALVGTLHSMILGVSTLLKDTVHRATPHMPLSLSTSVYLLCAGIATCCLTLTGIDLFLSITALFVVTAYALSIITLLVPHAKTTRSERIIAACGLATAAIITTCALMGII